MLHFLRRICNTWSVPAGLARKSTVKRMQSRRRAFRVERLENKELFAADFNLVDNDLLGDGLAPGTESSATFGVLASATVGDDFFFGVLGSDAYPSLWRMDANDNVHAVFYQGTQTQANVSSQLEVFKDTLYFVDKSFVLYRIYANGAAERVLIAIPGTGPDTAEYVVSNLFVEDGKLIVEYDNGNGVDFWELNSQGLLTPSSYMPPVRLVSAFEKRNGDMLSFKFNRDSVDVLQSSSGQTKILSRIRQPSSGNDYSNFIAEDGLGSVYLGLTRLGPFGNEFKTFRVDPNGRVAPVRFLDSAGNELPLQYDTGAFANLTRPIFPFFETLAYNDNAIVGGRLFHPNLGGDLVLIEPENASEQWGDSDGFGPFEFKRTIGDTLFFTGKSSANGTELYRVGPSGKAEMINAGVPGGGIRTGPFSAQFNFVAQVGEKLFFTANDGTNGTELYRVGLSGNAEIIDDGVNGPGIGPGAQGTSINLITQLGDTLFFTANDGTNGRELYRVGPSGNAEMIDDGVNGPGIGAGAASANVQMVTQIGETLFFTANDGTNGTEIYRVGTSGNAELVDDNAPGVGIRLAPGALGLTVFGVIGETLFFTADDGISGVELWRVGTTGLAEMIEDSIPGDGIRLGNAPLVPTWLETIDNTQYFTANDGVHGRELWSVGITGQAVLHDLNTGPGSSGAKYLRAIGGRLFVVATTDAAGTELWSLTPDAVTSTPSDILLSNKLVYESAVVGRVLATLSVQDSAFVERHSLSLVSGDGDTHNAMIELRGNRVVLKSKLDFETSKTLSFRVRATNPKGGVFEKASTMAVGDVVVYGDINHDEIVDLRDFAIIRSNFNQANATFTQGDLNGDGLVDIKDFALLKSEFRKRV